MSRIDTAAIRARANAATPGEWVFERCDEHTEGMADTTYQHIRSGPTGVADTYHARPLAIEGFGPLAGYLPPRHGKVEDAAFIAAARSDVPQLCDRVAELEAAITQALVQLEHIDTNGVTETLRAALQIPEGP